MYKFKSERFFENVDSESKAYFLGLITADGSLNDKLKTLQLSLVEDDKHLLEEFVGLIYENRNLRKVDLYNKRDPNHKIQYQATVTSKLFYEDLKSYGLIQNKSNISHTIDLKRIPDKFIKDFIRGYFDGDGCVYLDKNKSLHISFTGNTSFLQQVRDVLSQLDGIGTQPIYYRRKENKINCTVAIGGNSQARILYNYMYNDANLYSIRKFKIFNCSLN